MYSAQLLNLSLSTITHSVIRSLINIVTSYIRCENKYLKLGKQKIYSAQNKSLEDTFII